MPRPVASVGWTHLPLVELASYHNGKAFKPEDWSPSGTRIIRIEQLNNPNGHYDRYEGSFPEANAIDDGDLIFSWSATLKVAIWRHGKGVLNQHLFKVVPKPGFDKRFTFYTLDFNMEALSGGSHGSTMKHIKRGELETFKVPVPPLETQQRIAEILSTVDEAIEQTEALIAKTQQIKAGLMHDLFTRGVTADGQLRPPREEAPHLYKESPLGWIPLEWKIATISEIADVFNGTTPSREIESYWGGSIPWVASGEVNKYRIEVPTECVTESALNHTSLRIAPAGSVVVALVGQGKTRGMSARLQIDATINQNLAAIVPDTNCSSMFLHLALHRSYLALRTAGRGSNRDALNCDLVRNFMIRLPPVPEQQRFERIAETLEFKASSDRDQANKLRVIKKGLMHKLLTCPFRTPVELATEQEEHLANV